MTAWITVHGHVNLLMKRYQLASLRRCVFTPRQLATNSAWWCPDVETLSDSLALSERNQLITNGFASSSLHKGAVMRSFDDFLYVEPEQAVEQIVELQMIWDAMTLMSRQSVSQKFVKIVVRI